jgi:hypothetical protein
MKEFYKGLMNDIIYGQYPSIIDDIINNIDNRMQSTYDYPLLAATSLLSIEGRAWFLNNVYKGDDKGRFARWNQFSYTQLDFSYRVSHHKELKSAEVIVENDINENDDPLMSEAMKQQEMNDEEDEEEVIEDVAEPPSYNSMKPFYDNALDSLMLLAESLSVDTTTIPDAFARWLYDPLIDDFLFLHKSTSIHIIFQLLANYDGMKEFSKVCKRIAGVPASECAVERHFSLSKIVINRLRNRMGTSLMNARTRIQKEYQK